MKKTELSQILNNQRGVALIMIMTAIIILMGVYGQFTFESKISRIKATNILDRAQAKLLAESGLQMAMARLRLYKEAYNKVQSNPEAKKMVPPQLLNQLWEVPFIYPIPITPEATRAFRDTVEKFQTESLIEGEMKVTVQNISNRLNLNMLRVDPLTFDPEKDQEQVSSGLDMNDPTLSNVSVQQSLYYLLRRVVDEKKEKDEAFEDRHANINYQEMISNLKYFISDEGIGQDPFAGEAESIFSRIPLMPKRGPMSSSSELYSIPGWNDEIIELIQNEFSVYPNAQVDLNKITANMIRILIPTITDDEIQEFYNVKNDPETPLFFNNKEDFIKYFVDKGIVNQEQFNERMKLFETKGISFGSNPNLFRIMAEGSFNRSTYTLVAFVVLPTQSQQTSGQGADNDTVSENESGSNQPANQNAQLLEPRIIEIQVN